MDGQPALVSHACDLHGERLVAPVGMTVECFCGSRTTIDVAGWAATQVALYPDEDIEQLAREAGVPAAQAKAAYDQRD